jgi:hypothetical protein
LECFRFDRFPARRKTVARGAESISAERGMMKHVRIGSGAGYSGDRIEPAVELAEKGNIQYLAFECLAERTIAIAQQAKMTDPSQGYDPLLIDRMQAALPVCARNGVKLITNMGAANPVSAGEKTAGIARSLGLKGLKIATVTGDDVLELVKNGGYVIDETGVPVSSLANKIVSANAYLGAQPIVEALANGANVIITGRVADPALFIAPLIYEFGFSMDDWNLLGKITVVGHLLECAGQVTGGYFADPGYKDIPNLARLGFPIAEVQPDGSFVVTKVAGSGGKVTADTCKEQLMYELHDPHAYITPDVVADFSQVRIKEVAPDCVRVEGGTGRARTDSLKVSIGYVDSYIGEGQISYAGPGAVERGRLAIEIVKERLQLTGVKVTELRCDLIGVDSIFGPKLSLDGQPREVRIRVAGRTGSMKEAVRIGNEVETLYTNGPACGGGAWKSARQVVAMGSTLIARNLVKHSLGYLEA